MNIVAIDTATEAFSVALKCGGKIYSRYQVAPRMHARLLLPSLDELISDAGIKRSAIDAVAFGRGPGAFTGVRIAAAAAQSIALAFEIPVAPVSTLAAIARRVHREAGVTKTAVAIDARMNEVYWGAFVIEDNLPQLVSEELVCAPGAVPAVDDNFVAAGTGWEVWAEPLQQASGAQIKSGVPALPHAIDILEIGQSMINAGQGVDAALALPVYLRDNVAKTQAQRLMQADNGNKL